MSKLGVKVTYEYAKILADQIERTGMARVAGSVRRKSKIIGDIDVCIIPEDYENFLSWFKNWADKLNRRKKDWQIIGGEKQGVRIELYIGKPDTFGALLQYATGTFQHNIRLRNKAREKGWKLNQYGLFDRITGQIIAGKNEEEIYQKLGMEFIAPEARV